MTTPGDARTCLTAALSDRYRLERELGQACPGRTRGAGTAEVPAARR